MSMTEEVPAHLQGNGRPTQDELTLTDLKVVGHIPAELDGRYLRNGANPLTGMSDHPFFGDGMIHGVRLRDGKAQWYRNRYVQTPFIKDPSIDILDPNVTLDMTCSKANTHIVGHAGKILALEEGHFPYVLDGDLNTVGPTDYNGVLKGPFTAHPKICPTTGEMLAFGYAPLPPYLTYLRVAADGTLAQVEPITVTGPTMMHDFNITENYVIFMDLPAVFNLDLALEGKMPIEWSDTYPARLGVMPRNGNDSQVKWYDVNPCYVFHPMNSYEDGDKIVLDVARFEHIWKKDAMDFPLPLLWRWVIDTRTGKVTEEQIDDRSGEFPRVNDAVIGKKHRYGYEMSMGSAGFGEVDSGAILKYDRQTGTRTSIELGKGRVSGEAVFAPAAGATAEDDGYLMTFVYDAASDTSEYVIFDAKTMSADPIATVHLPRVPFGFHGSWVPANVAN
jgi:carotenoid cleavage dioxygenase-like enzyme